MSALEVPGTPPPPEPRKMCPFMSGFAFGPAVQDPQSRLSVAQAGPVAMGVQFYGAACERENCELWSNVNARCSQKKEE